jgi:hypothetical protein
MLCSTCSSIARISLPGATPGSYRAGGRTRYTTMMLSATEFMRRFLLHVLEFPRFAGHYPKLSSTWSNSSGLTWPSVECRRRCL